MATFILTIEASVDITTGSAPVLDIFVDGSLITSSTAITAVAGVGSDLLVFTLDYDDSVNPYPSALSFQFSGSSGDGDETVTISSVRINGQAINTGTDLTATMLAQSQTSSLSSPSSFDYLFGRTEPTAGDLGTVTKTGTGGADILIGSDTAQDVIDGSGGNDRIEARDLDDAVNGGAGDDMIFGQGGNDIIIGGAGNDTIFGNEGDDLLFGQDDNDTISGDDGNDVINGGLGNDVLIGNAGNDVLYGESGDDRLIGTSGSNTMYGDAGNDVMLGGRDDDVMYGGDNDDTMHGARGNDVLHGDAGNDLMTGGAGDDLLHGGDGVDTLDGGAGDDVLYGGGLSDSEIQTILTANPGVIYSSVTGSFYQFVDVSTDWNTARTNAQSSMLGGVAGHLVIITSAEENTLIHQMGVDNGADNSTGAGGNRVWLGATDIAVDQEWRWVDGPEDGMLFSNGSTPVAGFYSNWAGGQPNNSGGPQVYATMWFNGGADDDKWDDRAAADTHDYVIEWESSFLSDDNAADILYGGAGDDQLYGGGGDDTLDGGADNDRVYGQDGNDTILGGAGDDTLSGGTGNDNISGDADDDLIAGGAGTDTMDGGTGTDTIDYSLAAAGVTASLFAGTASDDGDGASDIILNFENIIGSAYNDTLTGDGGANTIFGDSGDDTLAGRGGVDALQGGSGTDTATYASALAGVTASIASGTASDDGDGSNDTFDSIENLTGSAFDDSLTGDSSANTLTGNGGNDTISGGGGNDILDGGDGDDTIDGGANADTIYGGVGNDTLDGSSGGDTIYALDNGVSAADADDGNWNLLNGGAGTDTLYGSTGLDVLNGGADSDILYSGAAGSIISLLDNTFDAGLDDFTYSDAGFAGGSDGSNVDIFDNSSAGYLEVFIDGQNNSSFTNGAGAFYTSVTTDTYLTNVQITFSYLIDNSSNGGSENARVYFEYDGTVLDDTGGNSYIYQATAGTNSGWRTVTVDLPDFAANSMHDLAIGILHVGADKKSDDAYIRIDDVTVTGNTGIFNELNGGAAQDSLYGNNGGTDHFAFTTGESNDNDQIYNFSLADQDAIDLISVLNAVGYESVTDNITNYIQITTSGSDSIIKFDATGSASFGGADTIATIIGVTGLTDEAALEAAGTLLTPLVTLDIIGTALPDLLQDTAGHDYAIGGLASDDLLYGHDGDDALYGFAGSDTAYYASAAGAVTASLATGVATNDGFGDTDTFNSIENLTGSAFGDNLTGDAFANILTGLAGNDTLDGGDGNDTLIGGAGNDSMTGGNGTDTADYTNAAAAVTASLVSGGTSAGGDGDGGTDTYTTIENITGSAYNDALTGDNNANILAGLAGNDTLIGNGGTDTLNGGAGTDTVDYSGAAAGVIVDLGGGAASNDGDGAADILISIENVTGSGNADTIIGSAGDNTINGGNGNDSLTGKGGADVLNGGGGTDTADYITAASAVTASLAAGSASNDGDGGTDSYTSIENLSGSNFNDTLTGDGNANVLAGNVGSDTLNGGGGNDTLYALGTGVAVATTFINQNFATGYGSFAFAGTSYSSNSLDANDNDGNDSAHINLGRNGGPPSSTYTNLTGTYTASITFTQDTDNVEISLFYNIIATNLDAGENPVMNIIFNGSTIFTDGVTANGGTVNSGWLSTGTLSIGSVSAGTYTLQLQGVQSSSNRNEDADFYFDQVLVTGDVGSATGDAGYTNTLNGGDGQDSLYGADGIDIFVFDDGFGNDNDLVYNFTTGAGNDALDISDILSNAGYDSATDLITDFVQITTVGADSELRIDTAGTATFGGTALATIIGVTGLTDEAALEASGNLIT